MRAQVVLITTLVLNAILFALNLAVAILSGSRTVLSQAILAVTDLVGSALLLGGLYLSRRPANVDHPFGFGKERFFWAFVSIVVTFTTAGLVTLIAGVDQLLSPHPVSHLGTSIVVVAATLAASVVGILVTFRELRRDRQTVQRFLASPHQGLKSVFYQDLVSVIAATVALGGLVAIYRSSNGVVDGAVAAFEGLLLAATGFVLSLESREYLVGRAVSVPQARAMLALIERDPRVVRVRSLQSMLLGPDDALVALKINFQDGLTTDQLEAAIDHVSADLRAAYPQLRHIVIEPES
jgi:cation diffusion facilitator family transporter